MLNIGPLLASIGVNTAEMKALTSWNTESVEGSGSVEVGALARLAFQERPFLGCLDANENYLRDEVDFGNANRILWQNVRSLYQTCVAASRGAHAISKFHRFQF